MGSMWQVFGQVGKVQSRGGLWSVDIAENRYDSNGVKTTTIWFNCLSKYEPRVKQGDNVLAVGSFEPSLNKNYPYAMMVEHIGVVRKE